MLKAPTSSKIFDRVLWQEAQSQRFLFALTVGLNVAISVCLVVQAFLISRVISGIFLDGAPAATIRSHLASLLLVIGLRTLLISVAEFAARTLAIRIKASLRVRLFRRLQNLGPAFVQGERTGELINTLTEGIEALDAYFSQYLPQLLIALIAPLIILLAVTGGDVLSAAILLVTAPLIPVFMALVGAGARSVTQRQWQSLSYMSAHFLDVLQGLPTLKMVGQSKAQIEKVARISKRYGEATIRVLRLSFLSALVLELAATLSVAVIAVQIGLRLLEGGLPFRDALFILILAPEFYAPMRMLGARFHAAMEGMTAGSRIFELMAETGKPDRENATPLSPNNATICFRHVTAGYENGERPALKDVSLVVEPGAHLAIVGESGAGKSTLVQLLLGFIQPQHGEILIGDVPLHELDVTTWLQQVAWAPQLPYLLNDTIAVNIGIGDRNASEEAISAAARMACIHDFIIDLPQGYETIVGEHGVRLSGGQVQRIALARAFLKKAPLLILDEPTAHLDPDTEMRILATIESLAEHCTLITITHRLNTIMRADQVVILQGGRVLAKGEPENLFPAPSSGEDVVTETALLASCQLNGNAIAPNASLVMPEDTHGTQVSSVRQPDEAPASVSGAPLSELLRQLDGHWRGICASVALGAMTVGSSIGLLGTSAYLISMASLQPSIAELNVSIVGVRFFGLARGIARYLERLATHKVTFDLLAQMRTCAFATLEPLLPAHSSEANSGDLLARVGSDVAILEEFYVRAVAPPLTALFVWFGATSLMWWFHWQLAIVLSGGLLTVGIILPLLVALVTNRYGQGLVAARASLQTAFVDALQGLADLVVFGYRDRSAASIARRSRALDIEQRRLASVSALREGSGRLLTDLTVWTILMVGGGLVQVGKLEGVYLAAVIMITMAAFEAVNPLPEAALHLGSSLHAAQRLFEIGHWRPAVSEPAYPRHAPNAPYVQVQGLTFRYNSALPPALEDINLDLPYGKRMAIVGPSGAGKSSLVNLLLRFWSFEEGHITLNGADIEQYGSETVRSLINVIAQKTYLFNASIGDNIRLSHPGASLEDVVSAARTAQLDLFIDSLPAGYDTMIGERGLGLSAGQRQRLALARALIRPAPILLLDEPTSSLDSETEEALLRSVYQSSASQTVIYIGHRLLFMEMFDEIVVLQDGRIVERGTHDTLLQMEGLYSHLWRLQQGFAFTPTSRFHTDAVL